jgi:hypothetical protein
VSTISAGRVLWNRQRDWMGRIPNISRDKQFEKRLGEKEGFGCLKMTGRGNTELTDGARGTMVYHRTWYGQQKTDEAIMERGFSFIQ